MIKALDCQRLSSAFSVCFILFRFVEIFVLLCNAHVITTQNYPLRFVLRLDNGENNSHLHYHLLSLHDCNWNE